MGEKKRKAAPIQALSRQVFKSAPRGTEFDFIFFKFDFSFSAGGLQSKRKKSCSP